MSLLPVAKGNISNVVVRPGGIAVATVEHHAPSTALATEVLYRRHAERVWRYCLHFLRRPTDAEDALQQTFLQAHRALVRGVEPESEVAWLLTIARNVCLTRADTQRRRGSAEVGEDPLFDLAAACDADDGVSEDVRAAFTRLPERQRRALFMREWQECSYAEIAEALDTSASAVETLLVRARRTLARELAATRRRSRDLAGLLGWLRTAVGSTAGKVAVGAAIVSAGAVGTGVTVAKPHHAARSVASQHAHVVVRRRSGVEQPAPPHAAAPTHIAPAPAPVRRRARSAKQVVPAPPAVAPVHPAIPQAGAAPQASSSTPPPSSAPAPAAAPTPVSAPPPAPAPAPAQSTTTASPATTTTVANVVSTATSTATTAASSTVDAVAQTVSNAVPAAAPVVTTAAQTVDQTVNQTAQTVDDTTQTVVKTVTNLLPGR